MASAFERQLKRLGLFGLSRLARHPRPAPTDAELAKVARILVVRPDERIGNAILIIPLLNALKSQFPGARLSLVMSRRYWDLREFIPSVDEFVPFDKKHYARNPVAFVAFVRRLRRGHFDLVFDASGDHSVSFTHLAITAYSGGQFRIGHDRGQAGDCYEVSVPVASSDQHETQRHLDLLRSITNVQSDHRPLLSVAVDSGCADRVWQEAAWDNDTPTVIIHPGARGRKRWPARHFADVAKKLIVQGCQVGVVWGPSDTVAADEMLAKCPAPVRALGILDFRDFVSLVRRSDVFFSGDCGPMHLAAAAPPKRGVVAVFVIDKRSRYGPVGPEDTALVVDTDNPSIDEIAETIVVKVKDRTAPHERRSVTA